MSNERQVGKTIKIVLLTVAGMGLLLVLSCGGCFYWGYGQIQEAEASAAAFLDDLSTGRLDEAYSRTSSEFQASASPERFSELIAKYPLLTSRSSRTRINAKVQSTPRGTTVFLSYQLKSPDGTLPVGLILIRETGWKVISMNLP